MTLCHHTNLTLLWESKEKRTKKCSSTGKTDVLKAKKLRNFQTSHWTHNANLLTPLTDKALT